MKLFPYDLNKLNRMGFNKTKEQKLLQAFIDSGLMCVKVENWTQENVHVASAALNRSVEDLKLNIVVSVKGGELYLINMNLV